MKYCRRENRVRIQMSTWIWTWERWARCPTSLLRREVPRQYGNSLWPGIQHGTHAQGVIDAVCSSSCSVQIHLLIGPWGTYELGWDFGPSFSLSLFLHRAWPFQTHSCTVLLKDLWFYSFPPSPTPPIQRKSEMTQHQSWYLATQKDFISNNRGQWQDSVTLEVLKDKSMPY